jgi:hypothetical protein
MPHLVKSSMHSHYTNHNDFKQNIMNDFYSIAKNQSIYTNSSVSGAMSTAQQAACNMN